MKRYIKAAVTSPNDESDSVKQEWSQNTDTDMAILVSLLADDGVGGYARDTLGDIVSSNNIKKYMKYIDDILDSDDGYILWRLSENPNLPIEVLEMMAEHPNPEVRSTVMRSPNITDDIVVKLSKDADWGVRYDVALHTDNLDVLSTLSKDKGTYVRSGVASNPNTPASILEILVEDISPLVRRDALKTLNARGV